MTNAIFDPVFVKEKKILLKRASEERAPANSGRTRSSHACLSAMVPAFAEPDIHSLSRILADRHRRLSVCSLPVLKQFEESLGSLISVAQSATAVTDGFSDRGETRNLSHFQCPGQRRDRSYSRNGPEAFDSLRQQRVPL